MYFYAVDKWGSLCASILSGRASAKLFKCTVQTIRMMYNYAWLQDKVMHMWIKFCLFHWTHPLPFSSSPPPPSSSLSLSHSLLLFPSPSPPFPLLTVWSPLSLAPNSCLVTEWGEWDSCSATCGLGMKRRERMVKMPPPDGSICGAEVLEVEKCMMPECRE